MLGVLAIHETDVSSSKHVAVTLRYTIKSSDSTEVNVYIGFSKYVTIGVAFRFVLCLPVIKASTTTEDVTQHMTAPHGDMGFTWLVDSYIEFIGRRILSLCSTSDGCNLAAAIEAVADDTVPQGEVGNIDITIGCIAATEGITCFVHDIVSNSILVDFLYEVIILVG